jgi:vacuolar-type H+-ATPase subunit E/Vma4
MGINLDKLVEEIVKESKARADEIKREALAQVEDTVSRARAEATREADQITRSAKTECDTVVGKRASQEKQKVRLLYLTEKNKVLDEIMKEVETKLVELSRDDTRYRPFLVRSIVRGMDALPSENVMVALSHADLRRYKSSKLLEEALVSASTAKTAALEDEPIMTIGGAVVTSQDEKVRVDCTLEAKRELMKTQLLAEISRTLFAS